MSGLSVVQLGNMGVFYKHRDNLYFPVTAYVLPTTLLRIPYSLAFAGSWTIITYWSTNMDPSAGRRAMQLGCLLLSIPCG